ncbi:MULTISPECIES: outer membrane protein [unclassified Neptuniibacter]|jgi:opacity protein-like surface antigen|uniref:outer membrane protein n=1 Tax=unclassified Neptuniibacter TaxID=2630693 RepID=UPI0026E1662A|nr:MULTISPECIES: porin family protein [unclassified Neptuniibacter]MDO6514062.1 porin family protein [Neptuniibacter sp. 2_MG-2023]MDO6594101.1 porin family protein [Neptuniibacter sp. 1_MG-2023]
MNSSKAKLSAVVSAVVLSSVMSAGAMAADGFYVGGQLQSSTFGHSIERNTGSATSPSITSFAEETDVAVGVHLGYKLHLTDDAFVVAEAFYNDENAETTNINNMLQTQLELNSSYGINFKAGVDVTSKFSVYGIAGATVLDFDIHNSYPFAPPMRSGDASEVGLSLGAGFEYQVDKQWSVKGEYIQINDLSFDPLPEVAVPGKLNPNEVDFDSLKLSVSYAF